MTDLRTAAQQALEALELGYDSAKAEAYQYHAAMAGYRPQRHAQMDADVQQIASAITALRVALAEPEGGGNLPPPLQEPKDFDHGIGADRFRVVRGAFWWHVLIGDSPTEHGKFHSRAGAEKMAADLLREFRNGAFVQHEAALAEPQSTHSTECYQWHHKCAVAEVQRLRAEMEEIDSDGWRCGVYKMPDLPLAEPVQEPVAWMYHYIRHDGTPHDLPCLIWRPEYMDAMSAKKGAKAIPLYTAPPQRKPLTDEEILRIKGQFRGTLDVQFADFARAVERAHGIGGQP